MPTPLPRPLWPLRLAGVLALAGAIVCVVGPALRGGWIWDDISEVTLNPTLRSAAGLRQIWFNPPGPDYLPVKSTVQWLEWHLWRDTPAGYHWANAAFHFAGSLLVWRVLARLGVRFSYLGGLLFAIHPVAMESVAWISEQKNTLSLPLLLLAMDSYLDFDARGGADGGVRPGPAKAGLPRVGSAGSAAAAGDLARRTGDSALHPYLRSLGWFLAAMLAKSSVVMFPFILLLYVWWRRGRVARRDLAASAPFFAVSLALGLVTLWFQRHLAIGAEPIPIGSPLARLADAGPALVFYLVKCTIPVGLMPLYPRGIAASSFAPSWALWPALLLALAWPWAKRRTGGRPVLFGLGFFVINLLPVLGFVPMSFMRLASVSDHFAYLPLVGWAALAAAGCGWVYARLGAASRPAAAAVLGAGVAALMLSSRSDAAVFRDSETLWAFAAAKNPSSAAAHFNLANARVLAGKLPESIPEFAAAVRLQPGQAEVRSNFGDALERLGREAEAQAQYEAALRARPDLTLTRDKLGNLLLAHGQTGEAIAQYGKAVEIDPRSAAAQADLAYALARAGRLDEAQARYEIALRLEPGAAENWDELGTVFALRGRLPEAILHYERALQIDPGDAQARRNLELARRMQQGGAR